MSNKMPSDNPAKTASGLKKLLALITEFSALFVVTCILGALIAIGVIYFYTSYKQAPSQQACSVNSDLSTTEVEVEGRQFTAEVAENAAEKARGLSDRECLSSDRAMLFWYEEMGDYCFWMKDMRFPIDMIWLDENKKIVTIADSVQPESYPKSYCPEKPAQYIVEVNAGIANEAGWNKSTQFDF
jgi:uncharacterized membrane protein (UPF0127 family)